MPGAIHDRCCHTVEVSASSPCHMNQRRAAEFFAGIGLMKMGLDHEGWTTVWANDLDEKKWEMRQHNINPIAA